MTTRMRATVTPGITLGLPAVAAVVLAVVATVLQVVQELVLAGHAEWQAVIAVFLVFLVGVGIKPLTGDALETLIHIPDWLATLLSASAAALAGALQVVHMTTAAHTVVIAVVTLLAALGFGGTSEGALPLKALKRAKVAKT